MQLINDPSTIYHISPQTYSKAVLGVMKILYEAVIRDNTDKQLYELVEKVFLIFDQFDIGMVYFIRNSTKNFINKYRDLSINGLPIELCSVVEENPRAKNLDDYINNILMKMNEDA